MIYSFSLPYRIKSKKNNRPIYKNPNTNRVFLGKNKQFKEFEDQTIFLLNAQKNRLGISKPITEKLCFSARFVFKGAQRADLDNMITSIFDLLQQSQIIKDDKQIKMIKTTKIEENMNVEFTEFSISNFVQ